MLSAYSALNFGYSHPALIEADGLMVPTTGECKARFALSLPEDGR